MPKSEEQTPIRLLTVADILAANDVEEQVVDVPEWGGSVKVRGLTRGELFRIKREAVDPRTREPDEEAMDLLTVVYGTVEPHFEPVQWRNLKDKSAGAIQRVQKVILALSHLGEDAIAAADKSVRDGPDAGV